MDKEVGHRPPGASDSSAGSHRPADTAATMEPPAGVNPDDVWDVPVGEIRVWRWGWCDEVLSCPECGQSRELHVRGRWGDPAVIVCAQEHSWSYHEGTAAGAEADRAANVEMMRRTIEAAAAQGLDAAGEPAPGTG